MPYKIKIKKKKKPLIRIKRIAINRVVFAICIIVYFCNETKPC